MTKLPSNLQPIISDEFEPADGSQRYLQLFERLSLLIGGGDAGEIGIRACELITEVLEVAACSITLTPSYTPRAAPASSASRTSSAPSPSIPNSAARDTGSTPRP